jgi:hypothetical protein
MSPIELQVAQASSRALSKLKVQGLSVNASYGYDVPNLPQDITSMSDEDVMDLYAKYVAYLEFINLQLWCAEVDMFEAENDKNLNKAKKKLELKNSGKAVAIIDAEIEVDSSYQEALTKHQELSNYHGLIKIISDKLLKDISFINREVTRRVNINKTTGRSTWLTT